MVESTHIPLHSGDQQWPETGCVGLPSQYLGRGDGGATDPDFSPYQSLAPIGSPWDPGGVQA